MDPDALLDGLNPAQRAAVTSTAAPLAILAGAGSGKTRVLTRRIAWRAATGDLDPRHVLALTFTRKAAGELPEAIEQMLDNPLAMEALGGMLFYLKCLNLDKDLVTQRNFNVYDPIREGKNLVLDGQTLGHMEVS